MTENRNQALFWSHAITFPKFGGAYAPIGEIRNLLNFAYVGEQPWHERVLGSLSWT